MEVNSDACPSVAAIRSDMSTDLLVTNLVKGLHEELKLIHTPEGRETIHSVLDQRVHGRFEAETKSVGASASQVQLAHMHQIHQGRHDKDQYHRVQVNDDGDSCQALDKVVDHLQKLEHKVI